MDLEWLPGALVTAVVIGLLGAGLYWLGLRLGNWRLRKMAAVLSVLPVIVIGLQLATEYFGGPSVFHTATPGPATGQGSVTQEVPFPVTDRTVRQKIELIAKPRWGQQASGPMDLSYQVKSPQGEVLLEGSQTASPADEDEWQAIEAEFAPKTRGNHTLVLVIPQAANTVDISVSESP